jgi:hypothetical protein
MAAWLCPFALESILILSPRSTWLIVLTERASYGRPGRGDPLSLCVSVSCSDTIFWGDPKDPCDADLDGLATNSNVAAAGPHFSLQDVARFHRIIAKHLHRL